VPYRFFSHTADAAVELEAPDEAGLREAGVAALRELLVGDSPVASTGERPIVPSGHDAADRLIHYLREVLYLYDTERFVPAEASPEGVRGEPFQKDRHRAVREVKAVTYHEVDVRRGEDGLLRANVVFDL
jgi:SHS2 domain-containing protein